MADSAQFMFEGDRPGEPARAPLALPGEVHPSIIVRDVLSRVRPSGHVVVFANEKGGVGKSTLAFHCSVALSYAGHKVLAVDLDRRQRSLDSALEHRDATAQSLQVDLPRPRHIVLHKQSGALLTQEIARAGLDSTVVVIDVAGHDSPIARYAIAMADTLVTPVNASSIDLELLGNFDPVTKRLRDVGHFARLVCELRQERLNRGAGSFDWMVMKNRVRTNERRQQIRVDEALAQLVPSFGFRLGQDFRERVAYRELFAFGLTHLDLKRIPGLAKMRAPTGDEILQLASDLAIPDQLVPQQWNDGGRKARINEKSQRAFSASLHAHMQPVST